MSENSWIFSSALLWTVYISSPWLNIFSSGIVTLANLVGRDPMHSSFGSHFSQSVILKMPIKRKDAIHFTVCCFTAYFRDYSKSLVSGYAFENRRKYHWNAILDSVWGYCFVWAFFTISRRMGIYPGLNIALLTRSPMTLSTSETAALRLNL